MQDEINAAAAVVKATKDPSSYVLKDYIWALGIPILGGIVAHIRHHRRMQVAGRRRSPWKSGLYLLKDVIVSGFVGLITFYLCEFQDVHPLMTASILGIAGHMGSRMIFVLEEFAMQFIKSIGGYNISKGDRNDDAES